MRTATEIENEIKEIRNLIKLTGKTKPAQKKRIELLMQIKTYIESNPREQFLINEVERIAKLIENKLTPERFGMWNIGKSKIKNPKKAFEVEMGIPELKNNLDVLKYILKL